MVTGETSSNGRVKSVVSGLASRVQEASRRKRKETEGLEEKLARLNEQAERFQGIEIFHYLNGFDIKDIKREGLKVDGDYKSSKLKSLVSKLRGNEDQGPGEFVFFYLEPEDRTDRTVNGTKRNDFVTRSIRDRWISMLVDPNKTFVYNRELRGTPEYEESRMTLSDYMARCKDKVGKIKELLSREVNGRFISVNPLTAEPEVVNEPNEVHHYKHEIVFQEDIAPEELFRYCPVPQGNIFVVESLEF